MKNAYRLIIAMSLLANIALTVKVSIMLIYEYSGAMRTFKILSSGLHKTDIESKLTAIDYKDSTDGEVYRLYYKHFPPWMFFVKYDEMGYVKTLKGVYN